MALRTYQNERPIEQHIRFALRIKFRLLDMSLRFVKIRCNPYEMTKFQHPMHW
jgi:hypothetical protein